MLSIYVQNSRTVAPSPTLEPQERLAQNSEVFNVNLQQNPCAQLLMLNVETWNAVDKFPFPRVSESIYHFFPMQSSNFMTINVLKKV